MPADILVIDDDAALRHILNTILSMRGFSVRTAYSVRRALALIDEHLPDLICADLMMPEESGLDFLAYRQGRPDLSRVPVIVISAYGEKKMIQQAFDLGANAYAAKPIGSEELVDLIQVTLAGR